MEGEQHEVQNEIFQKEVGISPLLHFILTTTHCPIEKVKSKVTRLAFIMAKEDLNLSLPGPRLSTIPHRLSNVTSAEMSI